MKPQWRLRQKFAGQAQGKLDIRRQFRRYCSDYRKIDRYEYQQFADLNFLPRQVDAKPSASRVTLARTM
jgi:hypothetical protein